MAENVTQFKAGKTLVSLLQQHGLKDNAIQKITGAVADLLEEARHSGAAQEQSSECDQSHQAASADKARRWKQHCVPLVAVLCRGSREGAASTTAAAAGQRAGPCHGRRRPAGRVPGQPKVCGLLPEQSVQTTSSPLSSNTF